MLKKNLSDFQLYFTYGVKLQIMTEHEKSECVMILNSQNNFFLDFVSAKKNLKILNQIFIPHMKNFRKKETHNIIKIRVENAKKSFYIIYKDYQYEELTTNLKKLMNHIKKLKYCVYSWYNLVYFMMFEMKIYKYKDSLISKKDVEKILKRLQIMENKKAQKKSLNLQKQVSLQAKKNGSQTDELNRQLSIASSKINSSQMKEEFYLKIKTKIYKLFESENQILKNEDAWSIFKLLVQKNEMKFIYDLFLEQNENFQFKKSFQEILCQYNPELWRDENQPLSFDKFLKFVQLFQQQEIDSDDIEEFNIFFNQVRMKNIFESWENDDIQEITYEEFCMYFFSSLNSIYPPEKLVTYQDMSQPLSHYFISSSHNTYLTGHQLYGKSGIEGYQRALEYGYRCLEIDVWEGKYGEPMVTHGFTLTKNYSFEEIIQFIKEHWKRDNVFPLILSLEMHCKQQQRQRCAQILQQYFGDNLLILDKQSILANYSPKELRGKILIKNDSVYPTHYDLKTDFKNTYLNDPLSLVTCIFKEPIKDKNFLDPSYQIKLECPWSIFSCSNWKLEGILENDTARQKLLKFTKTNLIRVFPDATKISSSNYSPIPFWLVGSQMVCFNIQTGDEAILINKVFFKKNGGKRGGYILKPAYMRGKRKLLLDKYKVFEFDIITLQLINKDLIKGEQDILEISIRGHKKDISNNEKYVFPLRCNFIHPKIHEVKQSKFSFKVLFPELSFFIFKIKDKQEVISQGCLPASLIRRGHRVLPLYNKKMYHDNYSFILMKVKSYKEAVQYQI